jgi:hypothetical protein
VCTDQTPDQDWLKNHHRRAKKPNGSKGARKIIGEQGFVGGGERVDDFQPRDLKPVMHIFGEQQHGTCAAGYGDDECIEISEIISTGIFRGVDQVMAGC